MTTHVTRTVAVIIVKTLKHVDMLAATLMTRKNLNSRVVKNSLMKKLHCRNSTRIQMPLLSCSRFQQSASRRRNWKTRYASNNGITLAEARKQLSAAELKELQWDVQEYIKYGQENAMNQQWMKELENASARFHISRLEALKLRTQQSLEVAFGNELDSLDGMVKRLYQSGYYHTCFEVQKGFNIGWEIGQIDERKLQKVISKPWAADGKTFSDRVWQSKTTMVNELHQQMTRTTDHQKCPW